MVVLAAGALAWRQIKKERPIVVQTTEVVRRDLTEVVVANGRIQPELEVKISPEVSGEIIDLPVKEGQRVKKGDLILRIRPDFYEANLKSAEANHKSAQAGERSAQASLEKAEAELKRYQQLFDGRLVSESQYQEIRTSWDVARAQHESATHQAAMAKASLDRAHEELSKTTISSPLNGTISKLNSRLGERVVGTATMAGTEVMIIADLEAMEARVDIGEVDIVLVCLGQQARLEVDAFRDRKFAGKVYEIANSAKTTGAGQQQEATKFEVKIRITEQERFLPGMSVTAEIETRSRTNVLAVPMQCVTTRLPPDRPAPKAESMTMDSGLAVTEKKQPKRENRAKPAEVVFLAEGGQAKQVPVGRGISDDNYTEITEGLAEGQRVISGSYKAINRELEDGKKIATGPAGPGKD